MCDTKNDFVAMALYPRNYLSLQFPVVGCTREEVMLSVCESVVCVIVRVLVMMVHIWGPHCRGSRL